VRRFIALALIGALLLPACDQPPVEEPFTAAATQQQQNAPPADPVQQGGDTLIRALTLLRENYPEGAEQGQLIAASHRGAWGALAQIGMGPLNEVRPPENSTTGETPQQLRLRYRQMAGTYSSKIDPRFLAHEMVRGMANSLGDCHTGFMTPKQVQDHVSRLQGTTRFGGVGVILRRQADANAFAVIEVFDGGPAAKAGMKKGDLLTSVDGEVIQGLGLEQVVALVRGVEGTPVRLGISRAGAPHEMEITRGTVSAPFIRAALLTGNIGYLHLYSFPEPLVGQLDQALRDFERRNVAGVVVDLRDNSGGSLDVVTKVTSRFVREGALFQTIQRGGDRTIYAADGSFWKSAKPVAVVVNGGTGSGGELFASAVKEHGVGAVVGTKTAGCVSTGQMFPLPDGSALEIATSRVVSGVRGAELNKVGVAPDEVVPITAEDLASDFDPQLQRAAELLLGR
jgi:carboxyl-terminal processing protease